MDQNNVFVVTASLRAKQGKQDALRTELAELIKNCARHEGLIFYSVQQNNDDATSFLFYEHFTSADALQTHLDSAELGRALPVIGELLESEPVIQTWSLVEKTGAIA